MATAAVELQLAKRSIKYDPNIAAPKPQPNAAVGLKSRLDPNFTVEVRFSALVNISTRFRIKEYLLLLGEIVRRKRAQVKQIGVTDHSPGDAKTLFPARRPIIFCTLKPASPHQSAAFSSQSEFSMVRRRTRNLWTGSNPFSIRRN